MKSTYSTFADLAISPRLEKMRANNHLLYRVETIVDWSKIKTMLAKAEYTKPFEGGQVAYGALLMYKMFLIQKYYGLSDRQLEEHMNCNILFMDFCGLGLSMPIPDHSTICRWRERFRQKGIFDKAFQETNKQLESKGIQVKNGMIVDATIVESSARPRKVTVIDENPKELKPKLPELVFIQNEENEFVQQPAETSEKKEEHEKIETNKATYTVKTTYSSDPEATWGYQGGFRYGYKDVLSVNSGGYVNGYFTTKANTNEVQCVEKMIEIVNPPENTPFLGDKGFESANNDKILEEKKLKNYIMKKQKKTKNPDPTIRDHNKKISTCRFVVERTIGTIKNCYRMGRARYKGINKVQNDLALGCIVHNLVRAASHFFTKEKLLPLYPVHLLS